MKNSRGEKVSATFDIFDVKGEKIDQFVTDEDDYTKIVLRSGNRVFVYRELFIRRKGLFGFHEAKNIVDVSIEKVKETSPLERNCWDPSTWKC